MDYAHNLLEAESIDFPRFAIHGSDSYLEKPFANHREYVEAIKCVAQHHEEEMGRTTDNGQTVETALRYGSPKVRFLYLGNGAYWLGGVRGEEGLLLPLTGRDRRVTAPRIKLLAHQGNWAE